MATIKEVAERAGVSTATVSHVINQTRFVAQTTCERVWQTMRELNYAPSAVARSLKVQTTNSIGMLVTSSTNPFFAEVVRGVERYCFSRGYNLILCNTEGNAQTASSYLQMLIRKRIDGLLVMCTDTHTGLFEQLQLQQDLPLVVMDWGPSMPHSDRIQDNSQHGGYLATRHLIDQATTRSPSSQVRKINNRRANGWPVTSRRCTRPNCQSTVTGSVMVILIARGDIRRCAA